MLQVSEAIRFEDEEEAQGERDFSEIQEQVYIQEHDNLLWTNNVPLKRGFILWPGNFLFVLLITQQGCLQTNVICCCLFRECFQRAEALRLKQEELLERKEKEGGGGELTSGEEQRQTVAAGEGEEGEEEGSSDDELMDELEMDWRAKHS